MRFSTRHEVPDAATVWSLYIMKALLTSNTELTQAMAYSKSWVKTLICWLLLSFMSVHGQLKRRVLTRLRSSWRGIRLLNIMIKAKFCEEELQPAEEYTNCRKLANYILIVFGSTHTCAAFQRWSSLRITGTTNSPTNNSTGARTFADLQQARLRQKPPMSQKFQAMNKPSCCCLKLANIMCMKSVSELHTK